jgi:hypothetical protein
MKSTLFFLDDDKTNLITMINNTLQGKLRAMSVNFVITPQPYSAADLHFQIALETQNTSHPIAIELLKFGLLRDKDGESAKQLKYNAKSEYDKISKANPGLMEDLSEPKVVLYL